jgi:AcrR family transcriptional regulator
VGQGAESAAADGDVGGTGADRATSPPPVAPPTGSPRRTRTRERLLDAAYAVFAEHGVHAATVEMICERAGFTRGAFYSNFTTKEELFFALVERGNRQRLSVLTEQVDVMAPRLEQALRGLDEDALGGILVELVGSFDDRAWCLLEAEFLLLAMRDPAIAAEFLRHRDRFEASLVPVVERALDHTGRVFVLDTPTALRVLVSMHADALQSAILAGNPGELAVRRRALARTVLVVTRPRDDSADAAG